jgi:hypothetical protein
VLWIWVGTLSGKSRSPDGNAGRKKWNKGCTSGILRAYGELNRQWEQEKYFAEKQTDGGGSQTANLSKRLLTKLSTPVLP